MRVVVITPPPQVVSLDLAKRHLRVDHDDDDDLIETYLQAAQATIDGPAGWLGRCIGVQDLELRLDGFATPMWGWGYDGGGLFWGGGNDAYYGLRSARIILPCPPLIGVTSVTYEDEAGVQQTLPSAAYLATDEGLDASYGSTFPAGRWEANAVRIRYRAGYDTTPAPIRAAILLMTGDLYKFRETALDGRAAGIAEVPMSTMVTSLLAPFRVFA